MPILETTLLGFPCEVHYIYQPAEQAGFDPPTPGCSESCDITSCRIDICGEWHEVRDYQDQGDVERMCIKDWRERE